jgi:hypothetical protein
MATPIIIPELCGDKNEDGGECLYHCTGAVLTEKNGWIGLCFRHMTILVLESTARAMKPLPPVNEPA